MHLKSPYVSVGHASVRVYCSKECLEEATSPLVIMLGEDVPVVKQDHLLRKLSTIAIALTVLAPCVGGRGPAESSTLAAVAVPQPAPEETELVMHGPQPPTAQERADEFARHLGVDAWLHPLPGPVRRMPVRDTRVFGADRPGHRPIECRSGHCGVDLGGEVWGEPIFAVHDGVLVKVNHDVTRSGGKYVRIAHRDNTVFSHYFHLAAIPRGLRAGMRVRVGQTIGLLGETGVEESGPHLHFAISVRPRESEPETYVDPEPLIALWPVRVPIYGGALEAASLEPGRPLGVSGKRKPNTSNISALRRAARSGRKPPRGKKQQQSRSGSSDNDAGDASSGGGGGADNPSPSAAEASSATNAGGAGGAAQPEPVTQ